MDKLDNIVERKPLRKGLNPNLDQEVESAKTQDPKTGKIEFYARTINYINRKTGECEVTDWYIIPKSSYDLE